MAVRTSLAALITHIRQLIADTGGAPVFGDQQVQDVLDERRTDVRYAGLKPMPTYVPGPSVVYLDYYSDAPWWEDDWKIQDLGYNDISAQVVLAEPLVGHWQFASQPNGTAVRITGKVYDIYGSAADLLDRWAGILKMNFTFTSDSERFMMEQQVTNILLLAARYRLLAQPRTMRMLQTDAAPDFDGGGIVYPNLSGGREYT